ncbi:MAG: hypothetical protein K2N78_04080 [Oscillospiraceae bacterium]|nr:hypothetical protein [Oscillospiraceae bacterium]
MAARPREMPNMTPQQRRDNWWRYHWLHVLIAVLAVITAVGVLWERLTRERYDCSVALVTRYAATAEEIASMQGALERVCPDFNGDGKIHVAINAIQIDYTSTALDDAAIQVMTTNVDKLNSDFYTRQSGIFLLDDPENFQAAHGAMAWLDGSTPPEGALEWEKMTVPWRDWAGSTGVKLDNCEADRLWFARRAAFDQADEAAFAGADALWAAMFGTN